MATKLTLRKDDGTKKRWIDDGFNGFQVGLLLGSLLFASLAIWALSLPRCVC